MDSVDARGACRGRAGRALGTAATRTVPAAGREAGEAELQVYADALLAEGDIRGEHIALMLRGEHRPAATLRSSYRTHFYGPVSDWTVRSLHPLADIGVRRTSSFQVHWRDGSIDTIWVQVTEERVGPLVAFLHHPSCARLRVLVLAGTRMHGLGERIRAAGSLPRLERLHIGDFTPTEFVDQEAHQGEWIGLDAATRRPTSDSRARFPTSSTKPRQRCDPRTSSARSASPRWA